jgi:hypothetical protein
MNNGELLQRKILQQVLKAKKKRVLNHLERKFGTKLKRMY